MTSTGIKAEAGICEGKKSKIDRKEVHQKYGGRCGYCGIEIAQKDMQVDHIIPKINYSHVHKSLTVNMRLFTEYGLDDDQNLMPACRMCNNYKAANPLEVFRRDLEGQAANLRQYSSQFRRALRYGLVKIVDEPVKFYFEQVGNEKNP